MKTRIVLSFFAATVLNLMVQAQTMEDMWDTASLKKEHPNLQWFKDAKFGLFVHWGLYSKLGGVWKGRNYYGSGEWIMNQARIPVKEYEKVAAGFDPVKFNAEEWAALAKEAGARYMVVTAKHHEGFALFDSKVSDFTIVKATPYKKDPMKALAAAVAKQGIKFGFYYSQFVDWHEPNGGRNTWDFEESTKNYQLYYQQKAIPQLKELLTHYGPLGIVWFDLPGGLSKKETRDLVDSLHALQPQSLFSSRVGQGLGDYKDFGDSEVPPEPIPGAWEAIFTHNDSWGYIEHDLNFKSPREIIQLLANVASKGGNLMLNIGPDGEGKIPNYSAKYLKQVGKWLHKNGESIYGSTYGLIPAQPWGVTTSKPGRLFLHVLKHPKNGKLRVPGFTNAITKVYALSTKQRLGFSKSGSDVVINVPSAPLDAANTVYVVEYKGRQPAYPSHAPVTVSAAFDINTVEAVKATAKGKTQIKSLTYSHYFGDWKHATCLVNMQAPDDEAVFRIRVTEPGDYRILLEYACPQESARQEGSLELNGKEYLFRTLRTSGYENNKNPLMFIKHAIAIATLDKPGIYSITIHPEQAGKELFKLKNVLLEPIE